MHPQPLGDKIEQLAGGIRKTRAQARMGAREDGREPQTQFVFEDE